jgi:hypothetical protein
VAAFLERVARTPVAASGRGRLLFALDATASRQPMWDQASQIQSDMFREAASLGGLQVQLAYYRGFGEFMATPWVDQPQDLIALMSRVTCLGGQTQIARVLRHGVEEAKRQRVGALVFVGDAMEEAVDDLCALAGQLGLLGVPAFMFHEGADSLAGAAFRQVAQLSGGAYCQFDSNSPQQLRELLRAVAVYAAGGRRALAAMGRRSERGALLLLGQVK